MTTSPDDPRADEGLMEAMARAIGESQFGMVSGDKRAVLNHYWLELLYAAQAALTAARSHGGM